MIQKFIVCLLMLYGTGKIVGLKRCSDCVYINLCPGANALQNNSDSATIKKLRESVCDFGTVAGMLRPKICCTDFELEVRPENDYVDYEMHENIGLLPDDCGKINLYRLFEGPMAEIYEYPWMALLAYRSREERKIEFKCAGSIINSRYVLTAAHCVKNKTLEGVRLGEYDIGHKVDCRGEWGGICESHIQDVRVEKIIIHEQYDPRNRSVTNDIALLRVKNPIDLVGHRNVAPICLPVWKNIQNISLSEERGTVAGWGISETGISSKILKKVDLSIFNETACYQYINRNPELNLDNPLMKIICAGGVREDSCTGDSGGPLMIQNQYKDELKLSIFQVGIGSYGLSQCKSKEPIVYTDVTKYVSWILDNIEA